jgi:cobalt/nickel transport system permease protein
MLGTHAWIGIGEGLVTAALLELLADRKVGQGSFRSAGVPVLLGGALVLMSPLASVLPDGLQRVADRLGLMPADIVEFSAPLDGYRLAAIADPRWALIAAGAIGMTMIFITARVLGHGLARMVTPGRRAG